MKFAFAQKLLTFCMALAATTPLLISGQLAPVYTFGFAALVIAGWFVEHPLVSSIKFRHIITVLIAVSFVVALVKIVSGAPVPQTALEFALLLLGFKLCSRAGYLDYQQIAVLSFLHLIGATVITFDFSFGFSFVAFVLLSPVVLSMSHLRHEMERRFRHGNKNENQKMLKRLLASKRVVSTGFIAGTGLLALPVFLITIALFLMFPRFGPGFFTAKANAHNLSGFSSEVKIGDIDKTRQTKTVFIRMVPKNDKQIHPQRLSLKLRGAVFDRYNDNTWTRSEPNVFKPMPHRGDNYFVHYPVGLNKPNPRRFVPDNATGFTVLQESLSPPYIFVPAKTRQIITEPLAKNGRLLNRKLKADKNGVIKYTDSAGTGIRFTVKIAGAEHTGQSLPSGSSFIGRKPAKQYLELPDNFEREKQLARQMAKMGNTRQKALAVIRALKKNYRYSLEPQNKEEPAQNSAGQISPLSKFLFVTRKGTCEHFATAATLLLRTLNIPSRLVTGFSGAHWNSIGNFYSVTAASAHAWTEAYIDNQWVTLDATPPNLQSSSALNGPSAIAMIIDAMRMQWHRRIVGFDASSQIDLAVKLKNNWKSSGLGRVLNNVPLAKIFIAGVLIFLLFFVSIKFYKFLQKQSPQGFSFTKKQSCNTFKREATAVFTALENKLAKLGIERPANQTPNEYLLTITAASYEAGLVAKRVIDRYNQVRFGTDSFAPNEVESLKNDIKQINQ